MDRSDAFVSEDVGCVPDIHVRQTKIAYYVLLFFFWKMKWLGEHEFTRSFN